MSPETVALAAGILFLLIGVVGGGFSVEKAQIPQVPTWGRIVSSLIGLSFLGWFVYTSLPDSGEDSTRFVEAERTAGATDGVVHEDPEPAVATSDGIEVSRILVTGEEPVTVDARVTMSYRLTNLTERVVELDYTFIGVRDPDDENRDEEVDAGISLGPGESTDVRQTLLLDRAGTWTIWPCYVLPGDLSCPDDWRSFQVSVTSG
jgi:hypothetical protein